MQKHHSTAALVLYTLAHYYNVLIYWDFPPMTNQNVFSGKGNQRQESKDNMSNLAESDW